jgi:malonate transporter and related proteins
MLAIISIVLPIFSLIFAGWLTRRVRIFGPQASSELNRFVVYLALPALLFDIVANAHWTEIWQPNFIAVFGLGAGLIFVMTVATRFYTTRNLADAAIDGLNASYANTGFIGFPLAVAVLGTSSLAPTLIATIVTVCILFACALVLIEIGLQTEKQPLRMLWKLALSLARNPLLLAPAFGAIFLIFNITIPASVDSILKLLGNAAPPCALVALGLFLAEDHKSTTVPTKAIFGLVVLKLVAHPLITWFLATKIFNLSVPLTSVAVLLSTLPTGTGPFMVAELYNREAVITSKVILISTIASLFTITIYLAMA